MLAVLLRKSPVQFSIQSISIQYNQIRQSSSIFNRLVDNLKNQVSKDKELETNLQQFKQTLTQVNQNETIKAAKEFITKTKNEVLDKNKVLVEELRKQTQRIRQVSSNIVAPFEGRRRRKKDPNCKRTVTLKERQKMLKGRKDRRNLLECDGLQRIGRNFRDLFIDDASCSKFTLLKSKKYRDERSRLTATTTRQAKEGESGNSSFPPTESTSLIHIPDKVNNFDRLLSSINSKLSKLLPLKQFHSLVEYFHSSNNIFIFLLRNCLTLIRERLGRWGEESESAKVILSLRTIDPSFRVDSFLQECREFIIPDLIESFLNEDLVRLREMTTESTFNLLKANLQQTKGPNGMLDGQLFDLRNVDLVAMKIIDDKPILIVSFQTQQLFVVRDLATGEIIEGEEDKLELYEYVCAFTNQQSTNEESGGGTRWKVVEMSIRKL